MYIKVDSEVMQITELTNGGHAYPRRTRHNGGGAYTAGAAINRANVLADIMFAVRELVVYQYLAKRQGGRTGDGLRRRHGRGRRHRSPCAKAVADHRRKQIVSVR